MLSARRCATVGPRSPPRPPTGLPGHRGAERTAIHYVRRPRSEGEEEKEEEEEEDAEKEEDEEEENEGNEEEEDEKEAREVSQRSQIGKIKFSIKLLKISFSVSQEEAKQ